MPRWLCIVLAIASPGCTAPGEQPVAVQRAPLIYGTDDRLEPADAPDPLLARLAHESTLALFPPDALERHGSAMSVVGPTLAERRPLCPGTRFADQPAVALCSGALVDEDLVLTAAHCVEALPCDGQRWVFDYARKGAQPSPRPDLDAVYRCRSVPLRVYDLDSPDRRIDFAFVQLDRPVDAARHPAAVRASGLEPGAPLTVIGHPDGLPTKVDGGALVLDARAARGDYFLLSSDTFTGSSGSGVFDAQGELAGIVVRGGQDYTRGADGSCFEPRRVAEGPGEEASYAAAAVTALCASGWASRPLCGTRHTSQPLAAGQAGCSLASEGVPLGWFVMCGVAACRRRAKKAHRPPNP